MQSGWGESDRGGQDGHPTKSNGNGNCMQKEEEERRRAKKR